MRRKALLAPLAAAVALAVMPGMGSVLSAAVATSQADLPDLTSSSRTFPPFAHDCSRDVTAEMNAWLASIPDGATADLAGGCYRSNGTVDLVRRHGVTIEGGGATIKASRDAREYANRAQLGLNLGSDITIRILTLQGTHTVAGYDSTHEWDHNLRIFGTDGVLVDNVRFRNAWGDAVTVSPGGRWDATGATAVMARDVTVQNSSVDTTGRMGFACTGCKNLLIRDNTITNIGYHVVDVEVEGAPWSGDVTLLRNRYSRTHLALLASGSGIGRNRGPFIVRDNVRTDDPTTCEPPIEIGQRGFSVGAVRITGNNLRSYNDGVEVRGASSVVISDNVVTVGGGGCGAVGVRLDATRGVDLRDNLSATVTGNTFQGASSVATLVNTPATVCGNRLKPGLRFASPAPC